MAAVCLLTAPTQQMQQCPQDRPDDIFFSDPTRRWQFRGQTQQARLWRHSFDYLDDAEDPRFADHVARIIQHLRIRESHR